MEVPQFVEMTKDKNITVRFIEYMPFEGASARRLSSPLVALTALCNQTTAGRQRNSSPQPRFSRPSRRSTRR